MAKILLVDDDDDFIQLNKSLLEKQGHKVTFAYNPEDGMAAIKKQKPDLVILDVMMIEPDDGIAMAQKMKHEKLNIPVIMLTSISKVTGLQFGKDSEMVPVNEFFEKPVPADVLLNAVKKYVR